MKRDNVLSAFKGLSDEAYKEFNCKLIPGVPLGRVLGIRVPIVRSVAKRVFKGEFGDALELLDEYESCGKLRGGIGGTDLYYEEVLVHGMLLGLCRMELSERIRRLGLFVPRIDNWAVCDVVCGDLKFAKKAEYREEIFALTLGYMKDGAPEQEEKEFSIRFGVVMALSHYIDEEHIEAVLSALAAIRHGGYYVKMAVAWAISLCYIRFPGETTPYLTANSLDVFTHNKSIQKIRESYRISKEEKEYLNTLKRK